jgi:hypothetical protein
MPECTNTNTNTKNKNNNNNNINNKHNNNHSNNNSNNINNNNNNHNKNIINHTNHNNNISISNNNSINNNNNNNNNNDDTNNNNNNNNNNNANNSPPCLVPSPWLAWGAFTFAAWPSKSPHHPVGGVMELSAAMWQTQRTPDWKEGKADWGVVKLMCCGCVGNLQGISGSHRTPSRKLPRPRNLLSEDFHCI